MWTFLLLRPDQRMRWDDKMIKLDQAQAPTCPSTSLGSPLETKGLFTTGDVDEWWKSERCSIALGLIDGNSVLIGEFLIANGAVAKRDSDQKSLISQYYSSRHLNRYNRLVLGTIFCQQLLNLVVPCNL